MTSVTTSLKLFGIYMILIPGIGLMAFPSFFLDLFGFSYSGHLWMARVIGLLAFIIGVFDVFFAKFKLAQLYKLTVVLRYLAALFLTGLWITGQVEVMILLFAAVDAAGATWTMLAIKHTVPGKS